MIPMVKLSDAETPGTGLLILVLLINCWVA